MAKSSIDKFPRITPLKAFDLLRDMDRKAHCEAIQCSEGNTRTREALANHVKNALRRAGSR